MGRKGGIEKNMVASSVQSVPDQPEEYSWDKVQRNKPKQRAPINQPDQSSPDQPEEYSWDKVQTARTYQGEPDPTADEGTFGYLTRNSLSNVARAGERYLGRYGDVEKLARKGLSYLPEASGILGKALFDLMGKDKWERMIGNREPIERTGNIPSARTKSGQILPTSEDVKKITHGLTGEYTKPKTKNEARFQEFAADVGSMGLAKGATLKSTLAKNVGIPAAANAAKEVVSELGFGDDKATWTKLAGWTALSLMNGVNAPAYAASLMNAGRSGYGPNVTANVSRYTKDIDRVSKNMLHGDPRSALAQQQLTGIRNDVQNGQTSMASLMNRYDAINAAKRDRGLFSLTKGDRAAAIRNINQVRDAVRQEIKELGQANPDALKSWEDGVKAFSVIHQSKAISNTISNWLHGPLQKSVVLPLFGAAAYKAPIAAVGGAPVALALHKSGQVAFRVWNDPTLAKYYWQALKAAREENQRAFIANFSKLDQGYKEKYGQ